ncbi:hypothetical protein ACHHYP_16648 [Achlya hypogyna]|uniref:RING-type domain-containing protein n=1 Tax=Achlya hypogyna TaxID=1202772 RepID=A0A1V9Y651_ACHHY|nr:hypothetical protein ACHHYP_16648 [Achlya hypogyna]
MVLPRRGCSHSGCDKVDAGGGFCVGHGGGKKCRHEGCTNGYQRGGYCRKHGGGSRCTMPNCTKVDAGGGLCRGHGGGKRCTEPNCQKADVGGGFCTMHGGGKRCSFAGCEKNSQGGGFCRAHGGGKRCTEGTCTKMGRGANGKCPDHGGPAMCKAPNCRRIARGRDGYCMEHQQEIAVNPSLTPLLHPQAAVLLPMENLDSLVFAAPSLPKVSTMTTASALGSASSYIYRRMLLQVPAQSVWRDDVCLALLRSLPSVRSVHILGFRYGVSRHKASVCFILRGAMTATDVQALLAPLHCPFIVLEEAVIDDIIVTLEWTFHVEGMMCMGNCGTAVLNAIHAMPHVQRAQIDFEKRQLIVHSIDGNTTSFLQCIEGIGFSATKISMLPVPPRVRYTVALTHGQVVTFGQTGVLLRSVLEHIEGVEEIVLLLDQKPCEVIVIGMFDANEVAVVATTYGVQMTPVLATPPRRNSLVPEDDHVCDFGCGENGCPKYRTTMAHTAALAVGWSYANMDVVLVNTRSSTMDGILRLGADDVHPDMKVAELLQVLMTKSELPPGADMQLKMYGHPLSRREALAPYEPLLRTQTARWVFAVDPKLATLIPVFVLAATGQLVVVYINPADTIERIMRQVAQKVGRSVQRLTFCSKELRSQNTAAAYGISRNATLRELPRLRGGSAGVSLSSSVTESRPFVNLANDKLCQPCNFATNAPEWRVAGHGLNIHGTCTTRACEAFGSAVVMPRGMHPFNLFAHAATCPMCANVVDAISCGFHNCYWRFEGIESASKMHMSSHWREAAGGKYHMFSQSGSDIAHWDSLVIITKPMGDEEECGVCCEPMTVGATELLPRCKHSFHRKCVEEWARSCQLRSTSPSCPSCRVRYVLK